jgi:type I restriction enzyme S subunit
MSSKTQATATKEEAKPALVPKLRFPEFRGAEGWHPYVLEELEDLGWVELGRGEVISGQDIKAIPGDYPIYSSSVKNNGLMGRYGRFMFDEELISWSVDGGGDFFHRPPHKFSVTNVSGYMRLNTSHLNYRFLANHLQALHASLTFDYQFKAHPSVIRKLYRLAIPAPAEQQKIAECLSSVDELMAAQARKVDALKTHKKGLMQQLFPCEGETHPRLRFPEFQNAGEWEVQRLDELARYENGKAHENDISENGRYIVVNSKFISTEGEVRKFSNEGFCVADEGDVLMVLSDVPNGRAIAKCYFVESDDLYTVNQRICRIQPTKVNGRFLFYVLDRNSYFLDFDDGIKQTNLRKEDVVGFPLCVPPQPDEQQRIADCLTSLDDLIAAQTQKHEALKTHKKGLMQQLFPSPEEIEA